MKKYKIVLLSFLLFLGAIKTTKAQKVIDEVVAVVGDEMIMRSEIETQLQQMHDLKSGERSAAKCIILEQIMQRKLLLARAKADSLKVTDDQVENELGRRIEYFVNQPGVGSVEKLEQYYNKSIAEIKNELRRSIKEQLLADQMQGKVLGTADVTPAEVRKYYNGLPKDSLPYYNTEVEVGQIIVYPKVGREERLAAIDQLKSIKEDILNGSKFANKAIVFSKDNGSALKGGDLGMTRADNFVPEFAAACLRLKKDSLSPIVETKYGFHLIQMIERKGEMVHVRHILIKPEISEFQKSNAKDYLDSMRSKLIIGEISVKDAIAKNIDAQDNKNPEGLMSDPKTNSTRIPIDELDANTFFIIDKLKVGEFSTVIPYETPDGRPAFRVLYLKSKIEPHKANLKDDYPKLRLIALEAKKMEQMQIWLKKYIPLTYIRVDSKYAKCEGMDKFLVK